MFPLFFCFRYFYFIIIFFMKKIEIEFYEKYLFLHCVYSKFINISIELEYTEKFD